MIAPFRPVMWRKPAGGVFVRLHLGCGHTLKRRQSQGAFVTQARCKACAKAIEALNASKDRDHIAAAPPLKDTP